MQFQSSPLATEVMQNKDRWSPAKFVLKNGILKPSDKVGLKSKRMAGYIAHFYTNVIPQYVHGKLLDLGCGDAPLYELYSKYASGVCCADWKNTIHDQSSVDVFCDLNKELSFESASFDTVILSDVINHLEEPELALKEIHRILKPAGTLILNTPFLYNLNEEPYDYGRYSIYKLRSWAKKLNFQVEYEETLGGIADVFEHFLLRIIARLPIGKFTSRGFFNLRTFFITRKLLRVKSVSDSPYGYGLVLKK